MHAACSDKAVPPDTNTGDWAFCDPSADIRPSQSIHNTEKAEGPSSQWNRNVDSRIPLRDTELVMKEVGLNLKMGLWIDDQCRS